MARKPRVERREIERFQVSFHETMRQECAFLAAWFEQPWGRRQAWARGILSLGLKAQLADRHGDEDVREAKDGPASMQGHPVTLTLKRSSPEESDFLSHLDPLPHSRRSEWLRKTLLQGLWLSRSMIPMLTAGHPHAIAAPPPGLSPATENVPVSIPATVSWTKSTRKGRPTPHPDSSPDGPLGKAERPDLSGPRTATTLAPFDLGSVGKTVMEVIESKRQNPALAQIVSDALDTMESDVNALQVDIDLTDLPDGNAPSGVAGMAAEPGGKLSDLARLFK